MLYRFAVMPPGAATSSIMPTASATWDQRLGPDRTDHGEQDELEGQCHGGLRVPHHQFEVATVKVRPRPNITSARATGMKI